MILLRLFEFIAGTIAFVLIFSQVFLPLLTGRKLFPAFRKSRNKIEDEIREVQEQLEDQQLRAKLKELEAKLEGRPEIPVATPVSDSITPVSPEPKQ